MEVFGVRLGKLKAKLSKNCFKFKVALVLCLANFPDEIMEQHFWESTNKKQATPQDVLESDIRDGLAVEDPPEPHAHAGKTQTWRIHCRIKTTYGKVWRDIRSKFEGPDVPDKISPFEIAWLYYPPTEDSKIRDRCIQEEGLGFLSDVLLRYLRDMKLWPHKGSQFEGQGTDVWATEANKIKNSKDCDGLPWVVETKTELNKIPDEFLGAELEARYLFWDVLCTHDSREEEDLHGKQRTIAAGHAAKPLSFTHQSVDAANNQVAHEWSRLGGRDLTLPPPSLRVLHRRFAKGKRTIYKRKTQHGSTLIFFVRNNMTVAERKLPRKERAKIQKALAAKVKALSEFMKDECDMFKLTAIHTSHRARIHSHRHIHNTCANNDHAMLATA